MFTTKKQLRAELAQVKAELNKAQNSVKWGEYRNARYRRMIERASGKKFVFGYNKHDRSMIEGDERTYGWFIPEADNFGTYYGTAVNQ